MDQTHSHHIVSYKTYILILLALITMTLISIGVTSIELGTLTVTIALVLASIKTSLVLAYFMHLKFDEKIYLIMVLGVLLIFIAVVFVTFIDYLYR